jgi:hypothetical protein
VEGNRLLPASHDPEAVVWRTAETPSVDLEAIP